MTIGKWGQLTPREIESLDKDKTIVILPLGMLGSLDDKTLMWGNLRDLEDEAQKIMNSVNLVFGPLAEYQAVALSALWFGTPDPTHPDTTALPKDAFESVVKAICLSLKQQDIKYVLFVVHDATDSIARSVAEKLNDGLPKAWINVYNPCTDKDPEAAGPVAAACLAATALATGVPNPLCLLIPF